MDSLLEALTALDGWLVYTVVAILVLGESAAVVAVVMPGELALLVAGALAARGHVWLPLLVVIAAVAAVAGHVAGYEIGRRYGLRVLRWRPLRRYASTVDATVALVGRHGAKAVFLGRWTNVSRVLVPLLVGAHRMPYRTFTVYNVVGGTVWATAFVLLGSVAGTSLPAVERALGQASWVTTGALAGLCVGFWVWRRAAGRKDRPVMGAGRDGEAGCRAVARTSPRP